MQVNRKAVSKTVEDKDRSCAVSPLLMLSRGVCCLAHSNCVPDPSDVVVTHEISTFPFVPASCGSTTLRHPSNHSVLIVRSRGWKLRVLLSLIELILKLNSLSHGNRPNRQHITRASSSTSDQPLLTNSHSHHRPPHPNRRPNIHQSKTIWLKSQREPLLSSKSSLQASRLGQLSPWPNLLSPTRHHLIKSPHHQQRTPRMPFLSFPCSLTQSALAYADTRT